MKFIKFNYLSLIFLITTLSIFSIKLFSQSSDPENEKIKADALAMAYVTCDYDLAKYYYTLDKDNIEKKREFQQTVILKGQLSVGMELKYRNDPQLKLKYQREIEPAKKKLTKCIKYQSIMDSPIKINEEKQKEKEKEKEDTNK